MHPTKSEKLPVQKNVINVERYRFNDMIQVHFDDNEPHSRAHSQQCTMHRINLQVTVPAYFFFFHLLPPHDDEQNCTDMEAN